MNTPPQELYEEAMRIFGDWYNLDMLDQGACLYLSQVAMRVLIEDGRRPVLQAGTLLWRMVDESDDDGISPTHFGYQWSPEDPFSKAALHAGKLPELHVWVALPDEGLVIVDFSTGRIPTVAKQRHGYEWKAAAPPQYVFGAPPPGAVYHPSIQAIKFAWRFILAKCAKRPDLLHLIPA